MKITIFQPPYPSAGTPDATAECLRWMADRLARLKPGEQDLVLLPEYANAPGLGDRTLLRQFAAGPGAEFVRALAAAAQRLQCALALAALMPSQGRWFNRGLFYNPRGALVFTYDKVHLTDVEADELGVTAGMAPAVFEHAGIRYGFATCFDFYFPEHFEALAAQNPEIVLCPSYQRSESAQRIRLLAQARALDCGAYLARSSYALGDPAAGGHSLLAAPTGELLADAGGTEPGVLAVEIDPKRKFIKPASHRQPPVEHRSLIESHRRPDTYRPRLAPPWRTARELFRDCVCFAPGARPLLAQPLWLMPGVEASWKAEGATEADIGQFLELTDKGPCDLWVATHIHPPLPVKTIEENDAHWVRVNEFGATEKFIKGLIADRPMIIEHPVKTRADFARLKRGFAFQPGRFAAGWKEQALRQFKNGMGLRLSCRGFYGFPRELMGDEQLCLAMYDDPGLVHELNETYAVLLAAIADRLTQEGVPLESVYFWEDLAGNNGPLIGPGQFAEFLAPYYRRVIARFRKTGANFFQVDSDGNLQALIPNLLEAGVNGLVPCECRAGMDVVKLRALYPGLVLAGGLDKHAFVKDRAAIDKELEARVRPMLGQGGYLAMIDHRVLLGTTFADFSYYLHRAAEMLEITR